MDAVTRLAPHRGYRGRLRLPGGGPCFFLQAAAGLGSACIAGTRASSAIRAGGSRSLPQ